MVTTPPARMSARLNPESFTFCWAFRIASDLSESARRLSAFGMSTSIHRAKMVRCSPYRPLPYRFSTTKRRPRRTCRLALLKFREQIILRYGTVTRILFASLNQGLMNSEIIGKNILPDDIKFHYLDRTLFVALEIRDNHTAKHCLRVGLLSERVGRALSIDGDDLIMLREAGLFHDIGKIGVPDEILLKPAKLDELEFKVMQSHSELGEQILKAHQSQATAIDAIARAVGHHHERFDGLGYPAGLQKREIPLWSRIIAAADCYDAMTSRRPYHEAMTPDEALKIIKKESGTHFDPDVVEVLASVLA